MKLYYKCPIEAAYMAKNFGVKFQLWTRDIDTGKVQYQDLENEKTILGAYGFEGINFWVNPVSLPIFNVKANDVVITKAVLFSDGLHETIGRPIADSRSYKFDDNKIILFRDNYSFIMPEQESL